MIKLRILEQQPVRINVLNQDVVGMTSPPIQYIARNIFPDYDGGYAVTPGEAPQILPTAGTILHHDMVIEPIPSNYGRIEFDGAKLRIV